MTITNVTPEFIISSHNEALLVAQDAAKSEYVKNGDSDACGFAWVSVYGVRKNSKIGKSLAKCGFYKAYDGGMQLWNPSKHHAQSISVKEKGALKYAQFMSEKTGLKFYAQSRMD